MWRFTAINNQSEIAFRNSHNLDKPVQLPLPKNITVSPSFSGIRVNLDAVPGADSYALEIYRRTSSGLFGQSLFNSSTPSFLLPAASFLPNEQYVLRVRAHDRDFTEPGGPVENRSVNAVEFSVAVPETKGFFSTNVSLILGAVGIGLALLGFFAIPLGIIAIPAAVLTTLKVVGLGIAVVSFTNTVRIKLDPPDPNFAQPVVLREVTLPQVPSGGAFTPDLAAKANQTFAAQANVANILEAILTALERYQGAVQAGDFTQSGNRLNELDSFVDMLDDSSLLAAHLISDFLAALQGAGIQDVPLDITAALADLANNGFPPDVLSLLALFGFDASDTQFAKGLLLDSDPSNAPTTLFATLDEQTEQFRTLARVPLPPTAALTALAIILMIAMRRYSRRHPRP